MFKRNYKKLTDEAMEDEKYKEGLRKLRNENLDKRDILAIIIAMFQILAPFVLGIVAIYFVIILFLTKVWLK